ncbi:MAG: S49 family peptidase [Rhodobacteraceae bacterium]|nr:S49 family peptidase [Paracoccaceae bacterium]
MQSILNRLRSRPTVSVVRLSGVIASGGVFASNPLNDAGLATLLERAFRKGKPKAVALVINSPGGSPVQSSLIGARIRRLSTETKVPVYAFCEDVAASGGYWLASAADQIYVDASSIVGSIGVISASFGFHELLEKQGIERRVHTAGENKSLMDPFRPEKPEEVERLKALQLVIHKNFKQQITARRAGKLADRDLFTGEIWVGQDAIDVGLADGVAHMVPKMKEMFGDKVNLVLHGQRRSLFQRLGIGSAGDVLAGIEDRALWSRYGL